MVSRALSKASISSVTTVVLLFGSILRNPVDGYGGDSEKFCFDEASVDLTNARRNETGFFSESGKFFPTDFVRKTTSGALRGCICDFEFCLPLCPPMKNYNGTDKYAPGYFENVTAEIPPVYTTNFTIETVEGFPIEPNNWFHVFFGNPCGERPAYLLEPENYEVDEWFLLKNGSLFLPRINGSPIFLGWRDYCFRQLFNQTIYTPRVCASTQEQDPFRIASYIGGLVSTPFIILTIIVYSVLPELKNIHGNVLRCYLLCLLATYVTLAIDRIPSPGSSIGTTCLVLGFLIYFSFITTFLWLNVMCFDVCWRLGGFGTCRYSERQYERKKFIGYSIYAWGIGGLMTAISIGLEFFPGLSESVIRPGFQQRLCWFSTKSAAALFFFGPIGATILCNICFFVLTSVKLFKIKRQAMQGENCGDRKRQDDNKLLFSLYLKLFVVMGISWSTEVISGLWEDPKHVWYFTDMLNALQGVLIFVIFVCNKKICRSLRKRCKCFPRFSKNGCTFDHRSSDSKSTISNLDNSVLHPNNSMALNPRPNASPANRIS